LDMWNSAHSQPRKPAFAAIALISIALSGMVIWQSESAFQAQAFVELPPMTLTIVGSDGSQMVLNETDIGNLEPYRAYGGYKNQYGILKGLGNYTGVPINTFCDTVGGVHGGYSVRIVASDGYSKDMSFEELNGNLVTFDNVTGEEVQHNQTLTPILAYHYNDLNLSTSDGPLRASIVGPEGLCTNSTFWVKKVVRLELHPNLQPMNLTAVALNGTELTLNETMTSNLPALRAVGARRNQAGVVSGLGNYTGPSLNTFLDLVGGMSSENALRVTAADNTTKTLSYEEVNGAFATYDNVTGQPVQHNQSLTPILAYHFNDANLSLSDGPLRLAIVGPEGLATTASYWVKQVTKLEIRYRNDLAVTNIAALKDAVGQGFTCHVNVTVQNQGGYPETFNLTLKAGVTAIDVMLNLNLEIGASTTVTFVWNTTSFAKGNYALSAYASPVLGETETADNTMVNGTVYVGIPGDVDGNHIVNMLDLYKIAVSFGKIQPYGSVETANCDIDDNGIINMLDLYIAATHFGQTDP